MRALAWDDDPNGYMSLLKKALMRTAKISLQIEHDIGRFMEVFKEQTWDFVVTDLVDESKLEGTPEALPGIDIAKRLADKLPLYVITNFYDAFHPGKIGIPDSVVVKSKSMNASWMALDMVDDLDRRGLFVDAHRVFVIYGHDKSIDGLHQEVESFLLGHGLTVEWVKGGNLGNEILNGLLQKMNRCAAFIAICTPDDPIADLATTSIKIAGYQPRQNVLFEMGVAMGLSRGLERLIVLKKGGRKLSEKAKLPSDFGGVLTIRVSDSFDKAIPQLVTRLKQLNVALIEENPSR